MITQQNELGNWVAQHKMCSVTMRKGLYTETYTALFPHCLGSHWLFLHDRRGTHLDGCLLLSRRHIESMYCSASDAVFSRMFCEEYGTAEFANYLPVIKNGLQAPLKAMMDKHYAVAVEHVDVENEMFFDVGIIQGVTSSQVVLRAITPEGTWIEEAVTILLKNIIAIGVEGEYMKLLARHAHKKHR